MRFCLCPHLSARVWIGLVSFATELLWSYGNVDCFRGAYTAKRCCVDKDPDCWDAFFTEARCCNATSRVRGNPACWQDGYSFETCCIQEPKVGCWDSEFGPEQCCVDVADVGDFTSLDVKHVAVTEAVATYVMRVIEQPLGCEESSLWRAVKVAVVQLHVNRCYGMPGEKPDLQVMEMIQRHALGWASDVDEWEKAKAACSRGTLAALELVVTFIDRTMGEEAARRVYRLHEDLLEGSTASTEVVLHSSEEIVASTALTATSSATFDSDGWPLRFDRGMNYVPRLLGLSGRHHCHQSSLRLYIYREPRFQHMTQPVLTCSQKMTQCTASVHIHRWFERGSCVTDDPAQADLFYFPAYEACYNETACGFGNDTQRCFPNDFDPMVDLPYFRHRGGSNHIFVFGCNLLPLRDTLMVRARQSIMLTVESFQPETTGGNMFAWFSHWKDVLVPGYIPPWRINAMLTFNRPMIKRGILVAFHGHSSRHPIVGYMYKRSPLAEVRERIINYFWNVSGASVGPSVTDYFRRMGSSRFCLVPAGLTAWTIHLYEAFFFGCVPVILSDEMTVPFQDVIDWPSLSLQVASSIPMEELDSKLRSISFGTLKRMHKKLAEARCWFDYGRGWGREGEVEGGCSPYQGLLTGLEARARVGNQLYPLPRFWEPETST